MSNGTGSQISEWVRTILAIFIVGFVLIILSAIYWVKGIEDFKTVAAAFISLVTAVLGYYFGVKGSDDANKNAAGANQRLAVANTYVTKGHGIATKVLALLKQLPEFRSLANIDEIKQLQSECEVFTNEINRSGLQK